MKWIKSNLSELIEEFERGISYSSEDLQDGGVPMMNLACIDKSGYYRDGELKYYTGKYTEGDKVFPGDMLIACTDLTRNADIVGTPIFVPEGEEFYVFTMDLVKLVPKPGIDKSYLYYALKTNAYRSYIKPWASGTNVLHLDLKGVYDYQLYYPEDIEEQRRIAKVLSDLDSKIALNEKICGNLESIAQKIYDYWFVQFDFPDGSGLPFKSSGGEMTFDSILKRRIPSGWEVVRVGDILSKVPASYKLKTDEYRGEGKYPVIDQATGTYIAGFTDRKDALLSAFPAVVFGDHSCAVKYVNFAFCRGADGTQILVPCHKSIYTEYLYFAVKNIRFRKGYARHFSLLKDSYIIAPDEKLAKAFDIQVKPIFERRRIIIEENIFLTRLRNTLIPLLVGNHLEC